jgi:hypothetical protein
VRATLSLLRLEPRARWFFAVLAQSSLGTGAAHVALMLIAYERFRSPWAISLVLLADMVPVMLLGPILGAAGLLVAGFATLGLRDQWRAPAWASGAPGPRGEEPAAAGKST